jgi:hypothetical protein
MERDRHPAARVRTSPCRRSRRRRRAPSANRRSCTSRA